MNDLKQMKELLGKRVGDPRALWAYSMVEMFMTIGQGRNDACNSLYNIDPRNTDALLDASIFIAATNQVLKSIIYVFLLEEEWLSQVEGDQMRSIIKDMKKVDRLLNIKVPDENQ